MIVITTIFMYVFLIIGAIAMTAGILALALNLMVYFYESWVGFSTFRKFLRKYHKEMKEERIVKANADKAFEKNK